MLTQPRQVWSLVVPNIREAAIGGIGGVRPHRLAVAPCRQRSAKRRRRLRKVGRVTQRRHCARHRPARAPTARDPSAGSHRERRQRWISRPGPVVSALNKKELGVVGTGAHELVAPTGKVVIVSARSGGVPSNPQRTDRAASKGQPVALVVGLGQYSAACPCSTGNAATPPSSPTRT
jgi:hypothetical protein